MNRFRFAQFAPAESDVTMLYEFRSKFIARHGAARRDPVRRVSPVLINADCLRYDRANGVRPGENRIPETLNIRTRGLSDRRLMENHGRRTVNGDQNDIVQCGAISPIGEHCIEESEI